MKDPLTAADIRRRILVFGLPLAVEKQVECTASINGSALLEGTSEYVNFICNLLYL